MTEAEIRYRPSSDERIMSFGNNEPAIGFIVEGGPWEQRTPNTSSVEDFPTFSPRGGGNNPKSPQEEQPQQPAPKLSGAWGSRR